MTNDRTDTPLDQERRTEINCVCMCIVHCRVIADSKCAFQHSPLTEIATLMQDRRTERMSINKLTFLRFVRMTFFRPLWFHTQKMKTLSHVAECELFITCQICQPILIHDQLLSCTNTRVLRYVRIHQIYHRAVVDSSTDRKEAISQCFTRLLVARCLLLLFSLSLFLFPVMVYSS